VTLEEFLKAGGWSQVLVDTWYSGGENFGCLDRKQYDAHGELWEKNGKVVAYFVDEERGCHEYIFGVDTTEFRQEVQAWRKI